MMYISDELIGRLIEEDVPYIDLTTWVLGIGGQEGVMEFFTREKAVLSGTEEVLKVFEKLKVEACSSLPSGAMIEPGQVFIAARGKAESLHMAWKVSQNIIDHCSGIATAAKKMVDEAKRANPRVVVITTRKGFPGVKTLSIKAAMMGGAFPHRLGLSETVLVFKQHLNFLGGLDGFIAILPEVQAKVCEKKIVVEAGSIEEGKKLCQAGVDGIQFDKLSVEVLQKGVKEIRKINPHVSLLAAGGVNIGNAYDYASTGVDALVTSSLYSAKPIDIGVRIKKL